MKGEAGAVAAGAGADVRADGVGDPLGRCLRGLRARRPGRPAPLSHSRPDRSNGCRSDDSAWGSWLPSLLVGLLALLVAPLNLAGVLAVLVVTALLWYSLQLAAGFFRAEQERSQYVLPAWRSPEQTEEPKLIFPILRLLTAGMLAAIVLSGVGQREFPEAGRWRKSTSPTTGASRQAMSAATQTTFCFGPIGVVDPPGFSSFAAKTSRRFAFRRDRAFTRRTHFLGGRSRWSSPA
jgi:hypothetical protein